jgi:hypothetical protein
MSTFFARSTLLLSSALALTSGKPVVFEAGQSTSGSATYLGRKKRIQLQLGADTIEFSGAKLDKKTGQVTAHPEKTGQNVGVTVSQQLRCAPECETRESVRSRETCTYFVDERYTTCWESGGRVVCNDQWRQSPRTGTQWVETTTIRRNYDVTAKLFDRSWSEVAQASGTYPETVKEVEQLTVCR